jgi:hypothetical protein
MKKTKFEYLTEDGFGLTIEITSVPPEQEGPKFIANVTINKPEELSEGETNDMIDMTMATGMRQVMEMISWPEMFKVNTLNFQMAMGADGDSTEGMIPGLIMGGPPTQA